MLLVAVMACVAVASAAPKKVAVYVVGPISKADKSIVSSAVMARMSGNKDYAPFARNEAFLKALLKEQDYQTSGDVPESEIREVGGRLGVDYVIGVSVVISSDYECHMTAELINVETGAVLKAVSQDREYTGSSTLSAMAKNVAYRLLNKRSK